MTRLVNTNKNGTNATRRLHTDPDCQFVTPESKPVAEAPVNPDDLTECQWCSGEVDRVQDQDATCPFCDEQVGKLPTHLPCEASQ